jgi:hypothetical protein
LRDTTEDKDITDEESHIDIANAAHDKIKSSTLQIILLSIVLFDGTGHGIPRYGRNVNPAPDSCGKELQFRSATLSFVFPRP